MKPLTPLSKRVPRRAFLRGLAGATVGLPLLASLARPARGQAQQFPTRFIAFFHPNGVEPAAWFPRGAAGTDFTLNRCHLPLAPFQSKLVLTSGIDMSVCQIGFGEPHQRGMGAMLTGRENNSGSQVGGDGTTSGFNLGTSIDQVLASRIGAGTRFKSLELGVRADVASATGEVRNRMIYAAPESPVAPTNSPRAVFDRVFTDASTDVEALAALRLQRKSVLDAAIESLGEVRAKVSSDEKQKLEAHLELVRDLETRLTSNAALGGSCVVPGRPGLLGADNENDMPQISRLQIDLLVMALACDLTRVGSVQYSNALNHVRFPWLTWTNEVGAQRPSLADGHALSHDQDGTQYDVDEEWIVRDTWFAGEFAYLLQQLDSIPEGDGTLLDHTAILWVNELARGAAHDHANMPFVVAGGASGRIRTGQYLAFEGEPHNNLLLGLLHAFGFEDSSFGHPDFCTRSLPGFLL
jgi:hypothetical protein